MLTLFYHVCGYFIALGLTSFAYFLHLGKPRVSMYKIPLNKDGIPIPPHVDVLEASIVQLATLLDEYLLSLWGKHTNTFIQ